MIQLNDLIFYAVMIVLMIGVGVMGLKPSGVTLVVTQTHRNIILKDISWYFLTTGLDTNRRNHMLEDFKEYKVKEVNPVLTSQKISKFQSAATGFLRMIDRGLREQDISKPFQPFVLLEDDASKYRKIPHSISIPMNCDLLYIGISRWGIPESGDIGRKNYLFYTQVDNNLIKIQNMLSMHGIMICSSAGANLITRCMSEAFFKNIIWDIPLARSQSLYNVYALREPLVYQDKKYNDEHHIDESTKFVIKNENFARQNGSFKVTKNNHFSQSTSFL